MLARDFMNFFDASRRQGVLLSFGGDISENVLFSLGEVLKLRMSQGETDASVAKRVFAIFVEQAQNVIRYSADKVAKPSVEKPSIDKPSVDKPSVEKSAVEKPSGLISNGVIVVGMEGARFYVVCGNEMPDTDVPPLRARLDHIASLSSDELKAFYREKLRQPPDEGSLGGSIGLIEIARRSSAPVEYGFQPLDTRRSFFCLKAYI